MTDECSEVPPAGVSAIWRALPLYCLDFYYVLPKTNQAPEFIGAIRITPDSHFQSAVTRSITCLCKLYFNGLPCNTLKMCFCAHGLHPFIYSPSPFRNPSDTSLFMISPLMKTNKIVGREAGRRECVQFTYMLTGAELMNKIIISCIRLIPLSLALRSSAARATTQSIHV
jgi:hypothetical protein